MTITYPSNSKSKMIRKNESSRHSAPIRKALFFISSLILILLYQINYFLNWSKIGSLDYDAHYSWMLSAYRILGEFNQIPFWDPFHGGGWPFLYFPETCIASPFILLGYINPMLGFKISSLLFYLVGFWGAYLLSKTITETLILRWVFSLSFVFSGMHLVKHVAGMQWSLGAMCLPFLIWSLIGVLDRPEKKYFPVIGAICILFMVLQGSVYYLVYAALTIFVICLFNYKKILKPLVAINLSCFFILAISISSIKLLPAIVVFENSNRTVESAADGMTMGGLLYGLISPDQTAEYFDKISHSKSSSSNKFYWGFDENGYYISILGLVLVLFGIFGKTRSRSKILKHSVLVFLLIFSIYLASGVRFGSFNFFSIMSDVPIFSSMRVASRAMIIAVFVFPFFIVLGIKNISNVFREKYKKIAVSSLSIVQICFLIIFAWFNTKNVYSIDTYKMEPFEKISRLSIETHTAVEAISKGFASGRLIHTAGMDSTPYLLNQADYPGELFFVKSKRKASFKEWSPNIIKITIEKNSDHKDLEITEELIVNQTYRSTWHVQDVRGHKLKTRRTEDRGLLLIEVPSGVDEIHLEYVPQYALFGLILFSIGILFAFLWVYLIHSKCQTLLIPKKSKK